MTESERIIYCFLLQKVARALYNNNRREIPFASLYMYNYVDVLLNIEV